MPLGIAIAVVFFVAALAVTGPLKLWEGAVYGAALIAPATMLGVERGNVDLLRLRARSCSGSCSSGATRGPARRRSCSPGS